MRTAVAAHSNVSGNRKEHDGLTVDAATPDTRVSSSRGAATGVRGTRMPMQCRRRWPICDRAQCWYGKGGVMSTHAVGRHARPRAGVRLGVSAHWAWLAGGFLVAFGVPFLLADLLEINRDLF